MRGKRGDKIKSMLQKTFVREFPHFALKLVCEQEISFVLDHRQIFPTTTAIGADSFKVSTKHKNCNWVLCVVRCAHLWRKSRLRGTNLLTDRADVEICVLEPRGGISIQIKGPILRPRAQVGPFVLGMSPHALG